MNSFEGVNGEICKIEAKGIGHIKRYDTGTRLSFLALGRCLSSVISTASTVEVAIIVSGLFVGVVTFREHPPGTITETIYRVKSDVANRRGVRLDITTTPDHLRRIGID